MMIALVDIEDILKVKGDTESIMIFVSLVEWLRKQFTFGKRDHNVPSHRNHIAYWGVACGRALWF